MFGVIILERLFPYKKRRFGKDNLLTCIYFVFSSKIAIFTLVVVPLIQSVYTKYNLPSLGLSETLHPVLYILITLLAITFVDYWAHRWLHTSLLLWHIHKIHHAPAHLNWATRYHEHFAMQILHAPLWTVVSLFLGTEMFIAPMGIFFFTIDFLQHSNVSFNFRFLNYILSTPQVHRFHHSSNPAHFDHNFGGTLIIWDILFGTYYFDPKNPPKEYGLGKLVPGGFFKQQILPLAWIGRDIMRTALVRRLLLRTAK
jgi:sterol desaturase/sphingolipid hydroxylase (fatty acid hydroxylase superfamily)